MAVARRRSPTAFPDDLKGLGGLGRLAEIWAGVHSWLGTNKARRRSVWSVMLCGFRDLISRFCVRAAHRSNVVI